MANLPVIDATGGTVYMKATGSGTNPDPYVPLQGGGTVAITGGIAGTVAVSGTVNTLEQGGTVVVSTIAAGTVVVTGVATAANQTTSAASLASIDTKLTDVATQTTLAVLNAKIPASPATVGGQTTGNASLSSIDGKLTDVATQTTLSALNTKVPSQGQALAAASLPVVLPAAQVTSLTPLGTVAVSGGTINSVGGTVNTLQLNNGTVSVSNFPATQPISGTVGVSGTVPVQITNNGTVSVSSIPAISGTVTANLQPVTSGGLSIYRDINAGTAAGTVKASAGQLYGYYLANTGTITAYFKFYDKATGAGTADTPVLTLPLFGTAAANVAFANGIAFVNGISLRVTTGAGDTDAVAPAGTTAFANVTYK